MGSWSALFKCFGNVSQTRDIILMMETVLQQAEAPTWLRFYVSGWHKINSGLSKQPPLHTPYQIPQHEFAFILARAVITVEVHNLVTSDQNY